jgi:hypothetical protein
MILELKCGKDSTVFRLHWTPAVCAFETAQPSHTNNDVHTPDSQESAALKKPQAFSCGPGVSSKLHLTSDRVPLLTQIGDLMDADALRRRKAGFMS